MKNIYQCKVCFETFSLLRYLRKHVTIIPAVKEHQPNKCQSFYGGTGNLHENLKVNHRITTENVPTEEIQLKTKGQLISTCNQDKTGYSENDECRNIEDEHACLKFEPDEQDGIYFFDRETPTLPCNDFAENPSQRFVNNEDKAKDDNPEVNFLGDEEQVEGSIKRTNFRRLNSGTRQIGIYFLPMKTAEINSPSETTICKECKIDCTSLENLCTHYETLHKLPVVSKSRVIIPTQQNPKCKWTQASNNKEASKESKTHKCGICSKTFTTLGHLNSHKSAIHDGKTFDCNVCQKRFHWLHGLKKHKLSAHDGFRYKCNICEKKFSQLQNLNRHTSGTHDNVRFECDICQKMFKRFDNLKQHKLSVHEHNMLMYKCNKCPKQFRSNRNLRLHKASSHDGVRYKCDTCPKEYSLMSALKRHKSIRHKQ